MKFTLSWLKEHLETSASIKEISESLTMRGFEVESVKEVDSFLENFTVVKIIKIEPHLKSDKLIVCHVETGSGLLQVICDDLNVRIGMKSLLARQSSKEETIHGLKSHGMFFSARELQPGEDSFRVLELPADTPTGATALEVLALDPVFEIVVTPNRPDCLGVQGIARELAATGLGVFKTALSVPVPGVYVSPLTITRTLAAEIACPMFVGRFIRGVQNGPSPLWLQRRLMAVGLRPVSALVDITNLLSLDAARPLHIFDSDKLKGSLTIRFALKGEIFHAINDKKYILQNDMLVIADNIGPQSLAGLIGGKATACSETTVNVFLESALFNPTCIAQTGRLLSIESEARYRFERGLDPAAVRRGAEGATRLIIDLCGGEASTLVISGTEPAWRRTLSVRLERFRRLTGFNLPASIMRKFLNAVGCTVIIEEKNVLTVVPPSWRHDLEAEDNIIEEIVRLHGYHNVPSIPLSSPCFPISTRVLTPSQQRQSQIRRTLAARGMLETITLSFMSSKNAALFKGCGFKGCGISLANPMSAALDTLRPSLLPNLILAARRNATYGMPDSALFEIGPQFYGDKPGEQQLIAAGIRTGYAGQRHWSRPSPRSVDVFDVKADAMAIPAIIGVPLEELQTDRVSVPPWYHPGRSGALQLGPIILGWFGEIHPLIIRTLDAQSPLVGFEILLENLSFLNEKLSPPPLNLSPFHPVVRDFAFVMDNTVPAEKVLKAARDSHKSLIVAVHVFDLYEGLEENRKSLAISVTLQPTKKPFTDKDIESLSSHLIESVFQATGAMLRRPQRNSL